MELEQRLQGGNERFLRSPSSVAVRRWRVAAAACHIVARKKGRFLLHSGGVRGVEQPGHRNMSSCKGVEG